MKNTLGRIAWAASLVPYAAFLFLFLTPVGALAYATAATASTIWAAWKLGWKDHR